MNDEDQERFEDYLELEHYIETLQADNIAHPPTNMTREQARIYQMAALFHSAADESVEPRPEFVEQLKAQLLAVNTQPQEPQSEATRQSNEKHVSTESVEPAVEKRGTPQPARFFSRRGLLTGGAIAAASLIIGAGVEYEEQKNQKTQTSVPPAPTTGYPTPGNQQQLNIPQSIPTRWLFVTTLADLGNTAVRFTSNSIVGHVIRTTTTTDAGNTTDNVIALSAACTHMGCLVQWKNTERHFYCPCHGSIFGDQGTQQPTDYVYKLSPLPRLQTKIEQGNVYVEVPL